MASRFHAIGAQGRTLHAAAALLALALAGCEGVEGVDRSQSWERPQPTVETVRLVHTVAFEPSATALSAEERGKLEGFLSREQVSTEDPIRVVPDPQAGEAGVRWAEAVVAHLTGLGAKSGIAPAEAVAVEPPANTAMVVVWRYRVHLPACPDWTGEPGNTWNNVVTSNWGCANAVNFGLMVANPTELIQGQRLGPAEGNRAASSIRRYREDKVKAIRPEDVDATQKQQKVNNQAEGD